MRLYVFGREVGENERVKVNEFMAKLFCALTSEFQNRPVAFGIDCAAEKSLYEKAAGQGHFVEIGLGFVSDFKTQRTRERRFPPVRLKYGIHQLCRRGFSFRAGNANDFYMSGREAVHERRQKREREVVNGLQPGEQLFWDEAFYYSKGVFHQISIVRDLPPKVSFVMKVRALGWA